MEMPIWHNHNQSVKIRASWDKSYKIPTFNDRFWYPNGNPDLKPEDGTTLEGGLRYALYGQNTRLKINGTVYHMNVSNWIQWVNLDMWRPVNNQEVQNKGAELQDSSTTELKFAKIQGKINYAYNQTIKKKGSDPDSPSIGKQLIYTPRHVANAFIALSRNNWSLSMNLSYTGKRMTGYTREESMSLDPYTLFHMNASLKFSMKQHIFDIKASVNNLLDIQYQNVKNYAMPGMNHHQQ